MKARIIFLLVIAALFDRAAAQNCAGTSVGRTPLNDLGTGYYQGFQGGLYPAGGNARPVQHDSARVTFASQVVPRNAAGEIDTANGRLVLLSIGMSNTTQEFSVFRMLSDTTAGRNPKLVLVDGAQGGQTAAVIADSNANFWNVIDQRLAASGVTRNQVQVAWVKEANASPPQTFPRHAEILDSQFVLIARILKARYPNMSIAYWSSRIYAGYATTNLNPEPYAYENGFAVKWTIGRQISGDSLLRYSGPNPNAPWLAWGPYLWADGLVPRSDSLVWLCTDFAPDGTHPGPNARLKVAQMLLQFFRSDPTATPWFLRSTTTSVTLNEDVPADVYLFQNYPNPFNPSTAIGFQVTAYSHVRLSVYDLLGREVATLVNEVKQPGTYEVTWDAGGFSSGVYLYRLQAGGFVETRKLLLIR
jgi:hypothetical protein